MLNSEFHRSRASPNVRDDNVRGVRREEFHIANIHGRDDGSTSEIAHRNNEGVNGALRSRTHAPEQLPGPDANTGIDGIDLDTLPAEPGEDPGVLSSSPHDLGQDGGDGSHGELPASHLRHERPDPIPTNDRTVCDR